MKKLFTLVALLACFLGAKAEWVEDYKIDYSQNTGFPFYVMGYVPEWVDGVMTDYGAMYTYKTEAEEGDNVVGSVTTQGGTEYQKILLESAGWHQYFIADGIPTELDGSYKVTAYAKASEEVTVSVNMGWGWGDGQQKGGSVKIGTEWAEVEWEYAEIGGTSCNLVAQPGTSTATIEWAWVKVEHNAKPQKPTTWQEWLTSDGQPVVVETKVEDIATWMGNAETPWADPTVKFDDQTNNFLICAWSKEKGRNMNTDDGWDPFPADIEADPKDPSNKVFVCHGQPATTEGDAAAWDNQFWIESPKSWKAGETVHVHFRYMCDYATGVKTNTQTHKQNPSDYLIWHAVGDITFTNEWQEYDGNMTIADDMAGGWSIAFNLNTEVKDAVNFYFDDLSWQSMVLEEGYFLAGANTATGLEYDLDNAIPFEDVDGDFVATVGEKGNKDSYVNEVMISTVRGNDGQFKANTLKPSGTITDDPDNWMDYTAASNTKLKLPGSGVWTVYLDTEYGAMAFEMVEGEELKPIDVVTNTTEVVVHGQEREYTEAEAEAAGIETPDPAGQPWDNQFFIIANRELATGEVTHLVFKYKANKEAKTTTQCHGAPAAYLHWGCIGDVNFTTEWQIFDNDFTVPSDANNMKSIAFNMAEIKEACDYEITDVQWYVKADGLEEGKTYENLIDAVGAKNLYVKEGAGTSPHEYVDPSGISTVVGKAKIGSAVLYNLAGQRVANDYKGIVVKEGKKVVLK